MLRLTEDFRQLARLAARLEPRVASFQARHELERWLRRPAGEGSARVVPTAFYVETSSACRGRCAGCYVPVADREQGLRLDAQCLATVLASARQLRPDYVCIVGGEPLDESILATNLAWVRSAPDVRFLLCTGMQGRGDAEALQALGELPNLSVIFSVDGFAATHDRLRGEKSHARTFAALKQYARGGRRLCGASVTLRPGNWEETTSEGFLGELERAGCNYLVFDASFGAEALAAAHLVQAVDRLRRRAKGSHAVTFVNPFGRLLRHGFAARSHMAAAVVDYRGNVYASRRGAPLGNVKSQTLTQILEGPAFQSACRRLPLGGSATDDPRTPLFETAHQLIWAPTPWR